jgi:hypothetical protein
VTALEEGAMCPIVAYRPDRLLAQGEHAGYPWVITYNDWAVRCGYVRVPPGHPWHGRHYNDINAKVHGSLGFSGPGEDDDQGDPDRGWWVGFDCGHAHDIPDPDLPADPEFRTFVRLQTELATRHPWMPMAVRTQQYTEDQCRSLCEQAAAAERAASHE